MAIRRHVVVDIYVWPHSAGNQAPTLNGVVLGGWRRKVLMTAELAAKTKRGLPAPILERVHGVPLLPRDRRDEVWAELLRVRRMKGGRQAGMAILRAEFGTDDGEVIAEAFRLNFGDCR